MQDGRKTVTRRLIKPQPDNKHPCPLGYVIGGCKEEHKGYFGWGIDEYGGHIQYAKPPFQIEDILYVRETVWQKASGTLATDDEPKVGWNYTWCKRPSIHMPKEAARIWLKVTDVRVERLQDITEEQSIKEGFAGERCNHAGLGEHGCTDCMNTGWIEPPQVGFMYTWNSTVSEDWKKWESNPYVWIIEFERCENPEQGL